jgi:cyclic pyranopterin phosphate synthase
VRFPQSVAAQLRDAGFATAKGPVFHTAIVAGVMAAKRTHELIPFCHPLGIEDCRIAIDMENDAAVIRCTVAVHHRTGVEMEALTGASIAALTIYDMCKALSHEIVITDTRLLEKHGGKREVAGGRAGASAG